VNHVNFTHDFNPGQGPAVSAIDSGNGFGTRVFWTAVIPDSDVRVNPFTGTAQMHVRNLPELDYYSPAGFGDLASLGPTWQTGYFASTVSMDVIWNGPVTRQVNVNDRANAFAGFFNENKATVTWSAVSESGFSFTSNPGNFSTSAPEIPGVNGVTVPLNSFAQVGFERNGIFFPSGSLTESESLGNADNTIVQALVTTGVDGKDLALQPFRVDLALSGKDHVPGNKLTFPGNGARQPLATGGLFKVSASDFAGLTGSAVQASGHSDTQLGWDPVVALDALFLQVAQQEIEALAR
jgi:hypothetical protein